MELTKNYDPGVTEEKWYRHWLDQRYFNSLPDNREPFTVVIPPPNVTGVLHMGHTLNETVQDILVRTARMSGKNACWVPGSDHASIATEAKVVQMLEKEKGISKSSLSREEFLGYAFEWKEKYGNIIYNQIARLGCSVDWDRVSFTMDPDYYKAVIRVFVNLYEKGLIYRGARMIHWDPSAKTALSDEEVEYKEIQGKLYYVSYLVDDADTPGDSITVATQRPETIMGDTAICVNPADDRYRHLVGKSVIVPLVNRRVPVIADEYVDPAFGTGALKITPAHDINDYNLGLKYGLPVINTLNEDGTLSAAAEIFVGEDRFTARTKVIARLLQEGRLVKEEEYSTRLGFSQRTNAVVEPRISTQWFVKMKEMAGPALTAVLDGSIHIHPGDKFLATYKYWLENVRDWCISRQLWWGQQIPAWYDAQGNFVVAETEADARQRYQDTFGTNSVTLTRDEDVLDTWFSSWLWPMEVFKGITQPGNPDINYYYPASVLVTGQDIIFFWVARMIMAGMEFRHEKPFSDVYFTGMVRDKLGRKMSKQLGNSPELLVLIEKYGADAVRFGIMIASPAGNDLLFDEASLEQGRNFNNKLWNALKLVRTWASRIDATATDDSSFATEWFANRLNEVRTDLEKMFREFRLSEALKTVYSLIWDDFCSWYLEWVKPAANQAVNPSVYRQTILFFEELVQILHPFMPFITEDIYHRLDARPEGDDLCIKQFQSPPSFDKKLLSIGDDIKLFLANIREFRQANNLKYSEPIRILFPDRIFGDSPSAYQIIKKQVNASSIDFGSSNGADHDSSISTLPFKNYSIAIGTNQSIDHSKRKEDLIKELEYLEGFLLAVNKKLSNEKFVQNARPDVIELERKKQEDARAKMTGIRETIAGLN